jgi:hypothetical protein
MSEDDRHRSEDGHEPQGVVETIREEIAEVVEHVPQPVRWTVGKLTRLALLVFAGLLVLGLASAVLFFMNRTELVARELSLLLNRTLREHSDLVLEMRDIRGNPFTGFRAVEPRVRYRDGVTLLEAREMRVDYSALALLRGKPGAIDVTLEQPHVRLTAADGSLRLPVWRSDPARKRAGKPREVQVHLKVSGAIVDTPRPYGSIAGVNADVWADVGARTRVRLDRLAWDRGPWDSRLEKLAADLTADTGGVQVRVTELRSPVVELRGEGGWRHGDSLRHATVSVGRVRWRWLAKVFDNRTFDVPGEGAFVVDAAGDKTWQGRFQSTLEWDGLAAEGTGRVAWDGRELALDSLAARTPAGDLLGRVRWTRAGWSIEADAEGADPSQWQFLKLVGWPAGDLNGWFRYEVDTRSTPSGSLEARLTASEIQGWQADSAGVRVEFPAHAPDSFRVVAVRRGGRFSLRGRTDARGGWSGPWSAREFPLEEWPDGRATGLSGVLARGEGTAESRSGALYVTGALEGSGTRWASANFSKWTLTGLRGRLLPKPDLTASGTAENGFFLGLHVDKATAPLTLGDQFVRFLPLMAQSGDTTFTMSGQAAWQPESWWMTINSAEARSDQFHFVAEPPVRLSGDAGGVLFERLVANDRDAHIEARGRWASPGGPYDFEFTADGLDLARVGYPREWGLGGRAALRLRVLGRSGDPRWHFEGRAGRPTFNGHGGDSLSLVLSGGARRLELEDGRFELNGGTLRGSGGVERMSAPFPDSLSPTALVRWLKDAEACRGHVVATSFPVAPYASVVPRARGWDGTVAGTVTLSGRPGAPVLDVQARGDQFGWRDIRAERVEVRARYADGRLEARELRARKQNTESTASFSMPLDLALGRLPSVPDLPMQGRVDIPAGDLQVLPLIVPQLQSARGRFQLEAEIAGTVRAPRITGRGQVRDGVVRPINRSEVIEGLGADLHFDQSTLVLDTLWARQGRTGRLWARGQARWDRGAPQSYRFDLKMRDFAAAEEGLYALLFDGDFVVSDGPLVGGQRLPQVVGGANIQRGVIEFDFADQTEVQRRAATTQPLYWTYHIRAVATNSLRWRTDDADVEFDADLDLQQTPDSLLIYGDMHALRGTYWFLSTRFKMERADLRFDNRQGVDPLLDIEATTRIASLDAASQGGQETITARIAGRSGQPVITLDSTNPDSDQRAILEGLTVGGLRDEQGRLGVVSVGSRITDNYFARELNAQLSAGLSEFFQGAITEWELRRDRGGLLTGEGDFVVGVGSQVTDKLALRYQQRVPALGQQPAGQSRLNPADLFEQNVEAEYRLNRFIYVTSGVSRRRSSLIGPSQQNMDYNVNLKARWEY